MGYHPLHFHLNQQSVCIFAFRLLALLLPLSALANYGLTGEKKDIGVPAIAPELIVGASKAIGGTATRVQDFQIRTRYWWHLDFSSTKATLADLKPIINSLRTRSEHIHSLKLRKTELGDEIIQLLDAPALISLDISHTNVTQKGLKHILETHPLLMGLDLSALPIDADCLAAMQKLSLNSLALRHAILDDSAGAQLAKMPLFDLDLCDSSVGDEFLRGLSSKQKKGVIGLNNFMELNLGGTKITNDGLQHIRFRILTKLNLSRTTISSEAEVAKLIRAHGGLRLVDLSDTSVSKDSLKNLKGMFPEVEFGK